MKPARRYLASVALPGGRRLAGPHTRSRRVAFAWAERHLDVPRGRPQILYYPGRADTQPRFGWTYDRRAQCWRRTAGVPRS